MFNIDPECDVLMMPDASIQRQHYFIVLKINPTLGEGVEQKSFPHLVAFTFGKLKFFYFFRLTVENCFSSLLGFNVGSLQTYIHGNGVKLITLEEHFDSSFLWWENFKLF